MPTRFWPTATIIEVTKTKIGSTPGCNVTRVTFEFDQPVDAWAVRINSRSHLDGVLAGQWASIAGGVGFGRQPFGAAPFGRATQPNITVDEVTITDDGLLHGANSVTVYGRSLDGTWTPPVSQAA